MKKTISTAACITIIGWAGVSLATPFEIFDTTIDTSGIGGGLWTFVDNPALGVIELAEGESAEIIFGTLFYPVALAGGELEIEVSFLTPSSDPAPVTDTGDFAVASLILGSFRGLSFGDDPVIADYSFGGLPGGQLSIDFHDIPYGLQFGFSDPLVGTLTNIADPVPEPATMLLFGTGIAGLAGMRYRRRKH